jgi:DNA-binding MarR family transcriptional regulator
MDPPKESSPLALAALMRHLVALSEPERPCGGLTPAQWGALRYFGRANRFSRTVSAFADFNATARGTASQTVKALEQAGYVTRRQVARDKRRAQIDLTEAGWAKLAEDPAAVLTRAIEHLPQTERQMLDESLERLIREVAGGGERFGTCPDCAHLAACPHQAGTEAGPDYFCRLTEEYVSSRELSALCAAFVETGEEGADGEEGPGEG